MGKPEIATVEAALGKRPLRVRQVGITVHDDPDAILPQAQELVRQLDEGDGVLVLTDMIGATPSNIAARLASPGKVEVVGGVSLPMLIRALTYRAQPLAAVVDKAISGGRDGVVHLSEAHAATRS